MNLSEGGIIELSWKKIPLFHLNVDAKAITRNIGGRVTAMKINANEIRMKTFTAHYLKL